MTELGLEKVVYIVAVVVLVALSCNLVWQLFRMWLDDRIIARQNKKMRRRFK